LSAPRPSKLYENWDFWFENMPSDNPATRWQAVSVEALFAFLIALMFD
jgi:hypothetical protein